MENNLFSTILEKMTRISENRAVKSEMVLRHYQCADEKGRDQIDKILCVLTGFDMDGLLSRVEREKKSTSIRSYA